MMLMMVWVLVLLLGVVCANAAAGVVVRIVCVVCIDVVANIFLSTPRCACGLYGCQVLLITATGAEHVVTISREGGGVTACGCVWVSAAASDGLQRL